MAPTHIKGFILTRRWRDTPLGTEIEYWLATEAGPVKVLLTAQTSVAFVENRYRAVVEAQIGAMPGVQLRDLELKTFQQSPVMGVYATHFRQLGQLARKLQPHNIPLLEADVRPHDRYLMERFITAGVVVEGGQTEQSTILNGRLKPEPDYRPTLKIVSLDIETSQYGELYSIALDGMAERVVYMLGDPPSDSTEPTMPSAPAAPLDFALVYCPTRKVIMESLVAWFARNDPDALTGWNVIQFDLRILQKTADQCGVPLLLGRGRTPVEWRTHPRKQGYLFAPMPGRIVIDGIDALKAAVWSFPSFSLENVSQTLLGEGKAIGDEYDKMAEINRRYRDDKPALAIYNIKDCELVLRIFEKAKLLQFVMERAQTTGLPADHFGGSIAAFSHHYLPRMHRLGYVAPSVGDIQSKAYPGGYVMDSQPGFYDSVVVLDYKSLYPSIIRTYCVDPVGYAEGQHASDPAAQIKGPADTLFSRDKHCLPEIVTTLGRSRDPARPRDREAHASVCRGPWLRGHLRRYRFHLHLAGPHPQQRRSPRRCSRAGARHQPVVDAHAARRAGAGEFFRDRIRHTLQKVFYAHHSRIGRGQQEAVCGPKHRHQRQRRNGLPWAGNGPQRLDPAGPAVPRRVALAHLPQ